MDAKAYEKARKEVKKKKDFYKNLVNWLVFSLIFIAINLFSSGRIGWAKWPILFWGLSVVIQGFSAFGFPGLGKDWERKQLEEELQKIEMEQRLKERYLLLKEKQDNDLLNQEEKLDLEELNKIRKTWDDSELV